MDRETIIYIAAILENCGKLMLIKDKRTGTVYPYLRIKVKNLDVRKILKEKFGGTLSGNFFILSHQKAKKFLDIIKDYTPELRQKIELVDQLYNCSFSRSYRKEYKEKIYKQFMRLENDRGERV